MIRIYRIVASPYALWPVAIVAAVVALAVVALTAGTP
jgi:hypothetical protein